MPINYKMNVLKELKDIGYNTSVLRKERVFGESTIQQLRSGILVSWNTLDKICSLLNCQVGDVIEYVKD